MIHLPRKLSKKRRLLIIIATVVILTGSFGMYVFLKRQISSTTDNKHSSVPPTLPKPTDRLAVEPHNYDPGAQQSGVDDVHTSDESAGAAAFPTTQPNLVVEITSARQSGNQFVIAATISPRASGSCTIELTRADTASLTKTSPLVTTGDASNCKDTAIDITQAVRGDWTLTVKVQVGSNVATATKAVTLK